VSEIMAKLKVDFTFVSDDIDGLIDQIKSVVSNPEVNRDGLSDRWANVAVFSEDDAAKLMLFVSDPHHIQDWNWFALHSNGQWTQHRVNGPASKHGSYWLWYIELEEEEHAAAIKAGVAEDEDKFISWWHSQ